MTIRKGCLLNFIIDKISDNGIGGDSSSSVVQKLSFWAISYTAWQVLPKFDNSMGLRYLQIISRSSGGRLRINAVSITYENSVHENCCIYKFTNQLSKLCTKLSGAPFPLCCLFVECCVVKEIY